MEGHRAPRNSVSGGGNNEPLDLSPVQFPSLPPPPRRNLPQQETYIVQFPKDQVYRVPPRENAAIVERHRNPPKKVKSQRCCGGSSRVFLTVALIVVSIVAILGITFATLYFIFRPKGPTFTVANVTVTKVGSKNSPPQYEIWLKANNPNKRLGIEYKEDAVLMQFENAVVAKGKFPTMEQGRGSSETDVKIGLIGSNGPVSRPIEKSANGTVELGLDMKLGVRVSAAGLKTWVLKSDVACKLKVRGLGNSTRILWQDCNTNFKQY